MNWWIKCCNEDTIGIWYEKSIRADRLRPLGFGNILMLEASGLRVYCGSQLLCLLKESTLKEKNPKVQVPYPCFLGGFSSCHSCPALILKGTGTSSMKKFKRKEKEYESQVKRGNVSFPICVVITYRISHLLNADSLSLPLLNTSTLR